MEFPSLQREKAYFWLTASEDSVIYDQLALLLWVWGKAAYPGKLYMAEKTPVAHDPEAEEHGGQEESWSHYFLWGSAHMAGGFLSRLFPLKTTPH